LPFSKELEVSVAIMAAQGMVDPAIFEHLQSKIDEDTSFRDVCSSFLFHGLQLTLYQGTARHSSGT
jgi:hypothetical protein